MDDTVADAAVAADEKVATAEEEAPVMRAALLLLRSPAVVTLAAAVAMEATSASQLDTITEPLACSVLFRVVQRVPAEGRSSEVMLVGTNKLHKSLAKRFKEPLRLSIRGRSLPTNEIRRLSV